MRALVLDDAVKTFTVDQDKVLSPEETVRRFRARLSAVQLDVLKEAVRIDTARLGIPVYLSRCGADAVRVIGTKKQMGKGATPAQAEASAVMELAERFSFFSFVKNPSHFHTAALTDLEGPTLSFEAIARSVHDDSADLAAIRPIFESLPFRWTWAFNLTRGVPVQVPFDWFFAINEFNGPSAGNCKEEAILQGICEIVERHVCSIVSHERVRVPAIRAASATDPMVGEMLAKYARCGVHLFVSDFTLDVGIPTIGVMAYDPSTFPAASEIVWTAGTTPSPEKAFSRALTEVAQLAGDFNTSANYVASGLPKPQRLEDVDYVTRAQGEVELAALPDLSDPNIRVEVERCVNALAGRGYEVLLIETTHSGLQVPAFYTIIPGAHFRERSRSTSVAMFSAKHAAEQLPAPQAVRVLESIRSALPGKYYVEFYLGLVRLNAEQPEAALPHFRSALELNPDATEAPSIYSYLGSACKALGRFAEALDWLGKGIALDSERTDLHNLAGYCHFKCGDHAQAIAAFSRAIDLDPTSAIDYANLGVNYQALGETKKAVHCFRLALTMDPGIDFARQHLARLEA
jgi:ribosomal protein S12 methylthiotransferase accessory factor